MPECARSDTLFVAGSSFEDTDKNAVDFLMRDVDSNTGSVRSLGIAAEWLRRCRATHDICSLAQAPVDADALHLPTRVLDVRLSTPAPH